MRTDGTKGTMADQNAQAGLTTHVMESEHPAAREVPCILVIFGGAGDLSHRKLLPALYNLMVDKELPDKFAIVGFSMEKLDDDAYRKFARQGVEEFSRQKIVEDQWAKFAPMLHFVSGGFTDATDYTSLKKRLDELDGDLKTGGNARSSWLSSGPIRALSGASTMWLATSPKR